MNESKNNFLQKILLQIQRIDKYKKKIEGQIVMQKEKKIENELLAKEAEENILKSRKQLLSMQFLEQEKNTDVQK